LVSHSNSKQMTNGAKSVQVVVVVKGGRQKDGDKTTPMTIRNCIKSKVYKKYRAHGAVHHHHHHIAYSIQHTLTTADGDRKRVTLSIT